MAMTLSHLRHKSTGPAFLRHGSRARRSRRRDEVSLDEVERIVI